MVKLACCPDSGPHKREKHGKPGNAGDSDNTGDRTDHLWSAKAAGAWEDAGPKPCAVPPRQRGLQASVGGRSRDRAATARRSAAGASRRITTIGCGFDLRGGDSIEFGA